MTKLHPRENYIRRLTYHEAIMTALHLICISEATDHRGRTLFTMSSTHWVLTSATAAVVLITIVECSGDQPRSSDSGCRIWGLTILWYGNHTCVLGTYGMVWHGMAWYGMVWHGILACTWSPLTIASLARNWFWDGNCNCLLCLCTPLPTPSTHIRYMYQFDKHFSGPPNQIWRKNFEALLNIPPLTENTGHHMP